MSNLFFKYDATISPFVGLTLAGFIFYGVRSSRRRSKLRLARAVEARNPPPPSKRPLPWRRGFVAAIALAAVYLLTFRAMSFVPYYWRDAKGGAILMSFSFLFLGPFIAGVITIRQPFREEPWPVKAWILAPWIPILINVLLAISVRWEGLICAVFIVPPALISASAGGVMAGLLQRHIHRTVGRSTMYCLAASPLLLAVIETRLSQPLQTRTVETSVRIHAALPIVWRNIERVPPISRTELRPSWANAIGFPRPIEAALSHEGVGGVRNATFERGLRFTETITNWEPNRRLVFTIQADTASIPPTTLDEHVTVGGRFFDVLTGEYELQSLPNGDTLLHLSSRERLSTDFNVYAALWSDAVMRDMQSNILHVIRNRCETSR